MSAIYRSEEGGHALEQRYREILEQWPVAHEHLRVPTAQGETFVVACGPKDAPPVLLLHGSAANNARWMAEVPAWSQRLRLYAVDMIGEPGLSAPSRPPLDAETYAAWLDEVREGLGIEHTSIVAESLGGWLALAYTTRRPERVDRLALTCPGGVGRQKYGVLIVALLLAPFGRWGMRKTIELILGQAAPPEVTAFALEINQHFRPRREKLPVFDDAALAKLTMPVLVVLGARDALLDSAETQRRLEGHATVRLLPDAGHLVPSQTQPFLEFLESR